MQARVESGVVLDGFTFQDSVSAYPGFGVWLNAGISGKATIPGGLAIGLTLTFCILMGGPLTGASMNPSRTFGPDLVAGKFTDIWLYFVACPLGAAAAALLYHHLILARRED